MNQNGHGQIYGIQKTIDLFVPRFPIVIIAIFI